MYYNSIHCQYCMLEGIKVTVPQNYVKLIVFFFQSTHLKAPKSTVVYKYCEIWFLLHKNIFEFNIFFACSIGVHFDCLALYLFI